MALRDWKITMNRDSNASSQAIAASAGEGLEEIDLTALKPDPEQMSKIQQNAVKAALRSVTALRRGLSHCDSLTFGEWHQFSSAPGPAGID